MSYTVWAVGEGGWASVSYCPPGPTAVLHDTREKAEAAQAAIDRRGCGGRCKRRHQVERVRLAEVG